VPRMPISGLVVTLDREDDDTLARLSRDGRLTIGERIGRVVPVVAETATLEEGVALVDGLTDVIGVTAVDVVSIEFFDAGGEHGSS
jgi:hypothetical protein